LQGRLGRLREAADTLRESLALAEKLAAADPQQPSPRRDVAVALLDLSAVEFARGQVEASRQTAGRAVALFRGLVGRPAGKAHPYEPLLLAAALNRVAVAQREAGQLDAARAAHTEAIKLLEDMRVQQALQVNLADVLTLLARCRLEQCRSLAQVPKQRAVAAKNLDVVIVLWTKLAAAYPKIPSYRYTLSFAYLARAEAGRGDEARADFEVARRALEAQVKEFPQLPDPLADLGRAYAGLGRLARAAGDGARAADWSAKAADALGRAAVLSPDSAAVRRSLEQVRAELKGR
jgi:tetratricopeptide (TPR) repeat protein